MAAAAALHCPSPSLPAPTAQLRHQPSAAANVQTQALQPPCGAPPLAGWRRVSGGGHLGSPLGRRRLARARRTRLGTPCSNPDIELLFKVATSFPPPHHTPFQASPNPATELPTPNIRFHLPCFPSSSFPDPLLALLSACLLSRCSIQCLLSQHKPLLPCFANPVCQSMTPPIIPYTSAHGRPCGRAAEHTTQHLLKLSFNS